MSATFAAAEIMSGLYGIGAHDRCVTGTAFVLFKVARTLAHEYINEPTFWKRCLLPKLNISEFSKSIAFKLLKWGYWRIMELHRDCRFTGGLDLW